MARLGRSGSPRELLRVVMLAVVLLFLAAGVVGTATPALAGVRSDILGCNNDDAPLPASPYGDSSFIVKPSTADRFKPSKDTKPGAVDPDVDPFRHPETVSLESTYGATPQWWTYDNGCTGQFVAGAGTALSNILLEIAGILPNWSHALLDVVVTSQHSFLHALDQPVHAATKAVTAGVWRPWLTVALLLVAATVMARARTGRLAGAATAAGWALGVLLVTSILLQYPVESVRLVDQGVRSTVGMIASGFSDGHVIPKATGNEATGGENRAQVAIDTQFDDIIRSTQYRTWAAGVFGNADTDVAKKYGPRAFRATHFSWSEYAAYRVHPTGEGQRILTAKQDDFKKLAGEIKKEDPVAYENFNGGKWGQRLTTALVNLLVTTIPCGFLLLAGLAIVLSFALVRLLVPFAPAAGVLFMLDQTRDMAVGWLKRVVGPLVMGPIFLLVGLLLLRFDSAIFAADMWFVLKIALIGLLTAVAWRLAGPALPGSRHVSAALSRTLGTALGAFGGVRAGMRQQGETPHEDDRVSTVPRPPMLDSAPGGVYNPIFEARARGLAPQALPPGDFKPYFPPPRALGAGASTSGELGPGPSAKDEADGRSSETQAAPATKPDRYPGGYERAWPPEARRQWVAAYLADTDNVTV